MFGLEQKPTKQVEPEKWYIAVDCAKCCEGIVFAGSAAAALWGGVSGPSFFGTPDGERPDVQCRAFNHHAMSKV